MQYDGWSVVAKYRKCGKPNCRVCAEGKGHGPYYYGTRTIGGQRVTKYFGRQLPVAQDNPQDTIRRLQRELSHAQAEIRALQARIEELQRENDALRQRLEPPARELTRDEVQALWDHADKRGYNAIIQTMAYDSLMRTLFGTQDTTRLRTGTGARPYICPFRGPRYRFASPEKLVETAIPWLLEATWRELKNRQERAERQEISEEDIRRRFAHMDDETLIRYLARIDASLHTGDMSPWTVDRPTLEFYRKVIGKMIAERMHAKAMDQNRP